MRPDARVTAQLRPSGDILAIALGLVFILIAACGVGLAVCLRSHASGRFIGAALLAVSLAVLTRVALDVRRSRIDLTTDGLVFHQVLHKKVIPVDNITGFAISPRRAGGQVMVRQVVGSDHTSLVCSGYRAWPADVQRALQSWLTQLTVHQPRWAQNVEGQAP